MGDQYDKIIADLQKKGIDTVNIMCVEVEKGSSQFLKRPIKYFARVNFNVCYNDADHNKYSFKEIAENEEKAYDELKKSINVLVSKLNDSGIKVSDVFDLEKLETILNNPDLFPNKDL